MKESNGFKQRPIKPERILCLGFLALILAGGLLLALPAAAPGGRSIGVRKALFTATSAVCVTGLTLIDVGAELSLFGQIVLLCLIQVGGLGFMVFATLIMVALGRRISLKSRVLLRESMNQTTLSGMVRLSMTFFGMAACIELAGAAVLATRLIPILGVKRGVWNSVFTAVSAFCNAGFDLFGGLGRMQREPVVLLTLCALIVLGGLGFPVLLELLHNRTQLKKMTLHAKLVLTSTGILLLFGLLITLALEWDHALAGLTFGDKLINSLFQSATLRTAGFASVDQGSLRDASKLLDCLLMFTGASSASTGGGVKTTTMALLVLLVAAVARGRNHIRAFGREISVDTVRRAITICVIGLTVVLGAACAISTMENGRFSMMDVLFETTSAFSTTGLSALNTPNLSPVSQWLLMPLMYLGRVGPLTLTFALAKQNDDANHIHYPEEKIMIG